MGDGPEGRSGIRIRLLGSFDLRRDGERVGALDSRRAQALLAWLLLRRGTPQPREHVAFLLWPDSTESQARTNLRHVLHTLRRALPEVDGHLDAGPRTLQWRDGPGWWLDVAEFEGGLVRADAAPGPEEEMAGLEAAVAAYGGDLLEGVYDDWVLEERARLRQLHLRALDRLSEGLAALGRHDAAVVHAEELLRRDPLREASYRLLMRLHHDRGDRARALRAYHACTTTLEHELGVGPGAATRALYEDMVRGAGPPPPPDPSPAPARPGASQLLVGRHDERRRLEEHWADAEGGRAHLVVLHGEPGVGKSRLAEELRSWCGRRKATVAEARSYAAEGVLAYGLVAQWLRSPAIRAHAGTLEGPVRAELARLLPDLLPGGRPAGAPAGGEALPDEEHRLRMFDATAAALRGRGGPVLLVADDAHLADPQSLEVVHYLLRTSPGAPVLVLATARPEEVDADHPFARLLGSLAGDGRLATIELDRLTAEETAALAGRVLGRRLHGDEARALYRETGGNPLFVIEAARAGPVAPAGPGEPAPALSRRVQSVVEARLRRLSEPARQLVGLAATVGREFTSEVLARAGGAGDEVALVGALDELWRRRIIAERGLDAYDFTHDKLREVAYAALSPARRRRNHLLVARALEAEDGRGHAGRLARHYEQAGAGPAAVRWYLQAAQDAHRLHAGAEAVELVGRARGVVARLPAGDERLALELEAVVALLSPLSATEGFASPELAAAQERGMVVAASLGIDPPPPLLRSVAVTRLAAGDFGSADRIGEQLRARAARDDDPVLAVEADYLSGIAAFWSGRLAAAAAHFESAVEGYQPEQRVTHLVGYGLDPKVVCLSRLANARWYLGEPAAAEAACEAALTNAAEIGHPASWGTALVFAALLCLETGEVERLRGYAHEAAARAGAAQWRPNQVAVEALLAYADAAEGGTAGPGRLRAALAGVEGREHAPGLEGVVLRLAVEAHAAAGDAAGALALADRALASGRGATVWEAELRRQRAGFLAATGAPASEVEAELRRALDVARRQGARAFEARVVADLSRAGTPVERLRNDPADTLGP